ncbi:hypothetical protein L0657_06625 [Dyadobacter sp. CY345]|uniref:hypothetical protein n=1 Tax=Dyadobacter sp. CY345 TaxID=2909335 RepID=UPI001F38B592|nr:hypothetical protein [Dyadobacter sp. CY345]MCF2443624.1 hypothetical protein [Dyadobacter sp. CY345]
MILSAGKSIFWVLLFLFLIFKGLELFIKADNNINLDKEYGEMFSELGQSITNLGEEIYSFLKPFLQLALILVLVDWILSKLGIRFDTSSSFKLEWNVQSLIAIIIISGFTIAALAGVNYADSLKDLALVVVGFYFGAQKRYSEYVSGTDKITLIDEHNPTEAKKE